MFDIRVERLRKEYISDLCVQVMLGFYDYNNNGVRLENGSDGLTMFEFDPKNGIYKNVYLDDVRRLNFPYGNIPVHKELFDYNVVNQILDYDLPYIKYRKKEFPFKDYDATYIRVLRDNNSALLLESKDDKLVLDIDNDEISNLETLGKIKIVKQSKPYVLRLLNRNIPKDEIQRAKILVKEKRAK